MTMKLMLTHSKRTEELIEAAKCLFTFSVIVAFLLSTASVTEIPAVFFTSLMLLGYLSWTFTEYFLHRFYMHSRFRKLDHKPFQMHMEHHKHPSEIKISGKQRLLVFISAFALTALAVYFNNYFTLFVGFFNGFLIYSSIHYILHQRWAKYILPNVQRCHIHHHGKYPDKGFSFSTTLWDWLFNTLPPKDATISKQMEAYYFGEHNGNSVH
jgi:sterol desaturase/sphingolipid hydroxylase (fatty acid hydroxylase superfamily)